MTSPQIPPPDPVTLDNVWQLEADPGALDRAADQWRTFARAASAGRDSVDDAAAPLRGEAWSGDASDTYHDHREKLGRGVDEVVEAATGFAVALAAASDLLRTAQSALADSLARASAAVPATVTGVSVTFRPRTADDIPAINAAVSEAQRIRADLDSDLVVQSGRIDTVRLEVQSLAGAWDTIANGRDDGWTLPPEARGTSWIYDGESVVLNTGPGNDTVQVRVDARTGEQIVTVNGVSTTFPPNYHLTIRAGQGNDSIDVAPGTRVQLTLLGGEGDDVLKGGDGNDRILGLDGRDHIEGRGGDDRLTAGAGREGSGADIVEHVHGGDGNDRIYGGFGNDYMTGGAGDDLIEGGGQDDTLDGQDGTDTVRGNAGTDNLYGRSGTDTLDGGDGRDYLDGGAGDDHLRGGLGDDTAYGMDGNDSIDGDAGQDYLEGGTGNDDLTGAAGNDMISGGRGDDVLRGGTGDDKFYSGWGRDTVVAAAGNDQVFGQNDDTITGAERVVNVQLSDDVDFIKVTGSPDFVARVEADLDMLRASPTGQQMLANLQKASDDSANWFYDGNGLTISELTEENGKAPWPDDNLLFGEEWAIEYNPSFDTVHNSPPVTVLYHEMAHVYDYAHDTLDENTYQGADNFGVPNYERVAAGLPIDHDGDPSTPDQIDPDHPLRFTENGLREELGAPRRPSY
ncbi:M91 family zinc metallopeptidase [Actinoplanes sp. NPDC051475]|uniref:M91 family zinc metallopeptidase n=1 Tax=Actinoplanes sp. NPDC051475 TaxID=3157225 RepID=UPI00344F9689